MPQEPGGHPEIPRAPWWSSWGSYPASGWVWGFLLPPRGQWAPGDPTQHPNSLRWVLEMLPAPKIPQEPQGLSLHPKIPAGSHTQLLGMGFGGTQPAPSCLGVCIRDPTQHPSLWDGIWGPLPAPNHPWAPQGPNHLPGHPVDPACITEARWAPASSLGLGSTLPEPTNSWASQPSPQNLSGHPRIPLSTQLMGMGSEGPKTALRPPPAG